MQTIPFYKYHGAGNDFVLVDNRNQRYTSIKDKDIIASICHRRFGIGADGLMLIESDPMYDFKMVYYNADGEEGSMCGNGGRCITALAARLGIIATKGNFIASDGPHDGIIKETNYIELKMQDVHSIDLYQGHAVLNTGSPHYVLPVKDIYNYPVVEKGKSIRYSSEYPQGINVNFIEEDQDKNWIIRTYERGVEDETWACGTGATAAALAIVEMYTLYDKNEILINTKGGPLTIKFQRQGPGYFTDVWLCGGAEFIYQGEYKI